MLVIARNPRQGVQIISPSGELLEIAILSVVGGVVKLGLTAPKDWLILRNELVNKTVKQEGEVA